MLLINFYHFLSALSLQLLKWEEQI